MPGQLYAESPWPALSQGDLFSEITITENLRASVTAKTFKGVTVMVLSHGCDIDKPNTNAFLCAQTRPLRSQTERTAASIRAGGGDNAMYLPAFPGFPESYVDFRFTHRVHRDVLTQAMAQHRRIACLSERGQRALQVYLIRFFMRAKLGPWQLRLAGWVDALLGWRRKP